MITFLIMLQIFIMINIFYTISLENRRQNSVSLNTSEAEYFAASKCGQQVVLSP